MVDVGVKHSCLVSDDCSVKCHYDGHTGLIRSVLSKAENCYQAIAFCFTTCVNFWRLIDNNQGSTITHWAAANGQPDVLDMICAYCKPNLSCKDVESGATPLHAAFLQGQITCAQVLLDYDASPNERDHEHLTPLDIVQYDLFFQQLDSIDFVQYPRFSLYESSELYYCGENINYTLGCVHSLFTSSNQKTSKFLYSSVPEPVQYFVNARPFPIEIHKVAMSKMHTIFLSRNGQVFSCGQGRGGRLGHPDESTRLLPCPIECFREPCIDIDVSLNHSIFLMGSGQVWTCGLNNFKQLGHSYELTQVLLPRSIALTKQLLRENLQFIGVAGGAYHSLFWTKDKLFVCGFNGGQLGLLKPSFSAITDICHVNGLNKFPDFSIAYVANSDCAVVIVGINGDIFLFSDYKIRRILTKQMDKCRTVRVVGGHLDTSVTSLTSINEMLLIVMLTFSGNLLLWSDVELCWRRVVFQGPWCTLRPVDVSLSCVKSIAIVSQIGTAYIADLNAVLRKHSSLSASLISSAGKQQHTSHLNSRMLDISECIVASVKRIRNIWRGIKVWIGPDGRDFCIVQQHPSHNLTELPPSFISLTSLHMWRLLNDTCESDSLHDLIFKCQNQRYAAHRYIVKQRCIKLYDLVTTQLTADNKNGEIEIQGGVDPEIFYQFLCFLYTNECPLITDGITMKLNDNNTDSLFCKGNNDKIKSSVVKQINPLKSLNDLEKRFPVFSLSNRLSCLQWNAHSGLITTCTKSELSAAPLMFDRFNSDDLVDVTILCEDGFELQGHCCILISRFSYFKSMLFNEWIEGSVPVSGQRRVIRLSCKQQTALDMLRFAYTEELDPLADVERNCLLLQLSDLILADDLHYLCQCRLAEQLSLRSVVEILSLSVLYNAKELCQTCLQFISLNLPTLIDMGALSSLNRQCLNEITEYYRNRVYVVKRRALTPWTSAPTLEALRINESKFRSCNIEPESLLSDLVSVASKFKYKSPKFKPNKLLSMSPVNNNQDTVLEDKPFDSSLTDSGIGTSFTSDLYENGEDRMLSSGDTSLNYFHRQRIAKKVDKKPAFKLSGWNNSSFCDKTVSLSDIMQEQIKEVAAASKPAPNKKSSAKIACSTIQSMTSAWGRTTMPSKTLNVFQEILTEEKKCVEAAERQAQKSLNLIQIEEKAIGELLQRHWISYDEWVTVERILSATPARPIWKAHV